MDRRSSRLFPTSPSARGGRQIQSNPLFQEGEVEERIDDVLDRVSEWREARARWTIMAAAMGRCYALGSVRGRDGKTAIAQMDAALNVEGQME